MIMTGIIALVLLLVKAITFPINVFIIALLPPMAIGLDALADYFEIIFRYIGWAISLAGIPTSMLALILAYYTFKLTAPLAIWVIKNIVNWYNTLKP